MKRRSATSEKAPRVLSRRPELAVRPNDGYGVAWTVARHPPISGCAHESNLLSVIGHGQQDPRERLPRRRASRRNPRSAKRQYEWSRQPRGACPRSGRGPEPLSPARGPAYGISSSSRRKQESGSLYSPHSRAERPYRACGRSGTLPRLSKFPFGSLLAHTQLTSAGDPDFRVQRSSRGRLISSASGEFRSRVLFSEGDPRTPEVYELRLTPGCVEEADPHAHDTYEHIVVLRGTLVVRSGEARAVLEAGDSIFFRADSPHGYENPGLQDTLAHLVMVYGARP